MFYFSGPSGDCLPLKKIKTEPPDGDIIQVTVPGMVSQPHGKAHAESFHISFVLFLVLLLVNNNHLCRNWNTVASWNQHEIPVGILDGNALAYFTYSQRGSVSLMVAFWFKNICSHFPPYCAVIWAFEDRRDILHYMALSLAKHLWAGGRSYISTANMTSSAACAILFWSNVTFYLLLPSDLT